MLSILALAAAAGCLLLLVFGALAATGHDHGAPMAFFLGIAPLLGVGEVALVVCLVAGAWVAAVPAAVLSLVHLGVLAHAVRAPRRRGGRGLRLVTANVWYTNDAPAPAIVAADPDVLCLQEVSTASGAWLPLPERTGLVVARDHDAFGVALVTRAGGPVEEVDLVGLPALRTRVPLGAGTVEIWTVHPVAPVARGRDLLWRRQLAELGRLLAGVGGPLVVVGDFNATALHRPFRELLAVAGLRDARPDGVGIGGTWPARLGQWGPAPPLFLRLDHVLVRDVEVLTLRRLPAGGSDHRPLLAELAPLPGR